MNKVKVKIKKLPISNQGSPNFNEMAYQYTSSNPLSFKDLKDSTRMIGEDQYEIGTNYPTEKDPRKANIEAEKGELILTKDFELYKINGKPHSKGGTPLSVNEGDFIFSKKLEGSGKDFNKIFGNFDEKKKYSYADVAARFLKMNDHKVLSQDSNPIDRRTGERMYNDYKDKLGMLAFLQEASKGLPNGIPSIAAPMIDSLVKSPMGIERPMEGMQGIPTGTMQLPTMDEQEMPMEEGQEMATAGQQFMKRGGPVLKKYVDEGEVKLSRKEKRTQEDWVENEYKPIQDYLTTLDPTQTYPINNHADYQKYVIKYLFPQLKQAHLDPKDPMELTNLARTELKSKGVANADQIKYWSQLPAEFQTDDFLKRTYGDGLQGYRSIKKLLPAQYLPQKQNVLQKIFSRNPDAPYTGRINPNTKNLNPEASTYRDLGYNTNENMAMMNALGAMTSIPYYSPTRMQNYGLQEGMGLASNMMPYNYQSLINEANRGAMRGYQANNAISPTSNIAGARNAMISGQLAEQNSKIKGEEYNQNANLYNTNQMQLAQMAGMLGQDKSQQGELYNNKVIQGRENLWANKKMANKEFIKELVNANNNRTLRNTVDFVAQSKIPNYRFQNPELASGYVQMSDPLSYVGSSTSDASAKASQYIKDFKALQGANLNLTPSDIVKILSSDSYKQQSQ